MSQKRAVAIQYESLAELPKVVASGEGELASLILTLAQENDIPIVHDEALASALAGNGIALPEETLRAVAEILCFLFTVDREWHDEHQFLKPIFDAASQVSG